MNKQQYHINYKRAFVRLANKYRASVYRALNDMGTDINSINEKPIYDVLYKLHTEAMLLNAKRVLRSLQKAEHKSEPTWREIVDRYLTTGGLKITNISETTRRSILEAIREAELQGLGSREIATYVSKKVGELNKVRALLITRTELTTALNAGSFLGANTYGKAVNKEWLSTIDNRTRRIPRNNYDHLHMDGVQTAYDGYFIVPSTKTIDAMQFPGDPTASPGNLCNCRCTLVFVPIKDGDNKLVPLEASPPKQGVAFALWQIMQSLTVGLTLNIFNNEND